ncbi:CoA pyrophosphatase [Allosphingosinicella flava]|uniref:CoA pyrophosphatase n=1 Tax=Allosphingosinicella flava TaxID=2771430 RepID=A0A7T2LLH0_9SPHN|nr:CoA pyrophosphatase [Sphingosinicella flava]QPQ54022.1 CoA pyrophosphatase [Sphingosinicella flava]
MSLIDRIRQVFGNPLAAHPLLLPGDPVDPAPPGEEVTPFPAAVLVPVVTHREPALLFTLRPETMRRHAGQVSFPGGRIDPADAGPVEAALREAEEEIALPRAAVEIIGPADPYRTVTNFSVTPIIGLLSPGLPLISNPGEVADIFEAPLSYLLDPRHQIVRTAHYGGRERHYYEILWEGRRIWGATAAMIVNLSHRLEHAR